MLWEGQEYKTPAVKQQAFCFMLKKNRLRLYNQFKAGAVYV